MSEAAPHLPSADDGVARARRARWAVTAAFATNGALLGALIPHYPEAKAAFGLDPAGFGLLVIALAVGGTLAGPLPAPLLRRFGAGRVMLAGSVAIALLTTAAGLVLDVAGAGAGARHGAGAAAAWPLWVFAGLVLASGVLDAVVDTAQNAQGLQVQTRLARPVLTTMHAGWSLGAAAGAGLGAAVITVGGPAALHLGLNGAVCVAVLLGIRRLFLADAPADPVPTDDASDEASARPTPARSGVLPRRAAVAALVPAVVIAMAGFGVEEFGNAWATLFLITERGLDPAAAVLGASTLLGAQFVGRLAGDRTLAVLGRRGALTAGLGAVVVGLGLALAPLPEPVAVPAAFAGLALAGLGCAVVVPVAYALGDEAPGLRPQTGLAVTSWCMRLAVVGLSPAVGALAGAVGLAPALTVFLGLAVVGAVLAARLPTAPQSGHDTPSREGARGVS
ncbi:MFS transporter [Micrococcus luteus]|uniref:MFS transporter n=1 Tax=Micrococcus luteus TaxID=1270 RepID=UPI0036BCE291